MWYILGVGVRASSARLLAGVQFGPLGDHADPLKGSAPDPTQPSSLPLARHVYSGLDLTIGVFVRSRLMPGAPFAYPKFR